MNEPNFEWYVLNYDWNRKEVYRFNIFNNIKVYDWTMREIKKYVRAPSKYKKVKWNTNEELYGFDALCDELRAILMNRLWSRVEYEISVGDAFIPDVRDFAKAVNDDGVTLESLKEETAKNNKVGNYLTKLDCFYQCEQNIPAIARECIYKYKEFKKAQKNGKN